MTAKLPESELQPRPAADRRAAILAVLGEHGPCLSNYLLVAVNHRTKQGIIGQQLNNDVKRLVKDGYCTIVSKATGLGPGHGNSRLRGQKMLVVGLVPELAKKKR
jgi:hypothetical protein